MDRRHLLLAHHSVLSGSPQSRRRKNRQKTTGSRFETAR
jgi:hypothetical protein